MSVFLDICINKVDRKDFKMSSIHNEQKYKPPGILASAGGIFAGSMASGLVNKPNIIINSKLMDKVYVVNNLNPDEFSRVSKGIDKTLKDTGLSKKGTAILKTTKENSDKALKLIKEEFNKKFSFLPQKIRKPITKFMSDSLYINIKFGQNAVYLVNFNKIIMPEKNLLLFAFHEMGHAANYNLSKAGKLLQKSRFLGLLVLPIALISLFKTKKAPDEKTTGIIDRTTNFIKENAGKLTFLAFVPMLAEEALASIKGNGFAKKVLDPSLAKKVSKNNKLTYLTYLTAALCSSIGIALGVKVKDAIAKPKPVE